MTHEDFMRRAIALANESVAAGGGPFGAVIVRDGRIIAEGSNRVTVSNDPTAHAEVLAIRSACRALGSFNLEGCVLYTSCEPCPMCLGAIFWARLERFYYGNSRDDAATIGFDDRHIYDQLDQPVDARSLPGSRLLAEEARASFEAWRNLPDKLAY
jgi:tRNA(Arg) A34 adenosine deaminase TadA